MLRQDGNEVLLIEKGEIQAQEFVISGRVMIEDGGLGGLIRVLKGNDDGIETIRLEGSSSTVSLNDDEGNETIRLSGLGGQLQLEQLQLRDKRNGEISIQMEGLTGNIILGGPGNDGDLTLTGTDGQTTISLNGGLGHAVFGGQGKDGKVTLKDRLGRTPISLDGNSGDAKLKGNLMLNIISLEGNAGSAILGGNGEDGEWLFGDFSIADAMYAPVVLRFEGYGIPLHQDSLRHRSIHWWSPDRQVSILSMRSNFDATNEITHKQVHNTYLRNPIKIRL